MNGRIAEGGAAPALRLSSICKRFGPLLANDSISLEVGGGEVVALLGENGAGKTTLMNILFGHYVADSGAVEVGGQRLAPGDPHAALRAGIGMVHQHFTLVENMSVAENVVLGTESLFAAASRRADEAGRIESLCEEIGLGAGPGAIVGGLSVGERQRVEIVKALYRNSKILILDEPTAVLAPLEIDSLFEILRRLVGRGLSVIFISHKLAEAMTISDRIIVLRKGRMVGERAPADTTSEELASMMVGEPVALPQVPPMSRDRPCLSSAKPPRPPEACASIWTAFRCPCGPGGSPASRAWQATGKRHSPPSSPERCAPRPGGCF